MLEKPVIELWNSSGLGLIILYPSGVYYSNQTGGYACLHPSVEGVYVPLENEVIDQEKMLHDYFVGPKWLGACMRAIDEETANKIDEILALADESKLFKVDHSRFSDSHEAWIYVDVLESADETSTLKGFGICKGILTWNNSD